MKKRVLAGIMMMVFVLASVMGVSAAPSVTADVTVDKSEEGYYVVRTGEEAFSDDKASEQNEAVADDVKKAIETYNKSDKKEADIKTLLKDAPEVAKKLEGLHPLTTVIDVHDVNGGNPTDGKHHVTLKVPTLPDGCKEVTALHYSLDAKEWEIIESKVEDSAKKLVTIISDDLSPIAIFAKVGTGSATGTSPSTEGTSSSWMLWTAAALIVLGAGVVATKKRSHS